MGIYAIFLKNLNELRGWNDSNEIQIMCESISLLAKESINNKTELYIENL